MSLSTEFDEETENQYMCSRWGLGLKGEARIKKYLEICQSQTRQFIQVNGPPTTVLKYGPDSRQCINIFRKDIPESSSRSQGTLPIFVYIHGGYWTEGDRSLYDFIGKPCLENNTVYANVGYRLSDGRGLDHCVEDIKTALKTIVEHFSLNSVPSLQICGHSAGSHLALCALSETTNKSVLFKVKTLYSVSGVYDLRPLLQTSLRTQAGLNSDQAVKWSLLSLPEHLKNIEINVINASNDPPALGDQSKTFLETPGVNAQKIKIIENVDHFSIIENLYDQDFELTRLMFHQRYECR